MALSWRFSMRIRLVKEPFLRCFRQALNIFIKYFVLVSIGQDSWWLLLLEIQSIKHEIYLEAVVTSYWIDSYHIIELQPNHKVLLIFAIGEKRRTVKSYYSFQLSINC
jgi:hypothetical protein